MDGPNGNGKAEVPLAAQLVISLTTTGQVIVGGPIDDPVLPFGMLQKAVLEVHKYQERKASDQRVLPVLAMPALPRRVS